MILGAVSIATEVKMTKLISPGQILSGAVMSCVRNALSERESLILSATSDYQRESLLALSTRTSSLLLAFSANTKSEVKSSVSSAWKTYKSVMTDLKTNLSTSRKNARSAYKAQIKTCK